MFSSDRRGLLRTSRIWAKKGFWSVTDQALFAGANFLLNIVLARWLSPVEYGAFTLAFTAFLLLGMFHTALITEPMLVFGSDRFQGRLSPYISGLMWGHGAFSVFGVLALAGAGFVVVFAGAGELKPVLLTLALAQPFILFMWLMRRACYVQLAPRWSAAGGLVYALLVVAGSYVLHVQSWLNASTALLLMSIASLGAGAFIIGLTGLTPFGSVTRALRTEISSRHWEYGKWAVATGLVSWLTAKLSFLLLPIWTSLEVAAAYRALINLIMPATHAYVALSALLIPSLVRAKASGNFSRALAATLALISFAMLVNWGLLGLFGEPLIRWLYDGKYVEFAGLFWIVGALPLLSGAAAVLGAGLRALERPNSVFWAYVASSATVMTVGILLIYAAGLEGALICQVLALITVTAAMAIFLVLAMRGKAPKDLALQPSYAGAEG